MDIIGIALTTKSVYVTGELAYRKSECFRKELSVNNASGSVWQPVTVTATGLTNVTGNVFVAKTPEVFSYDLDGNMTSDGRWNYTWDAENRLVKMESRPDTPSSSWRRIEWTYDAFGRRIQQITSIWTNNAWFVVENLKYVSDPMLFGRHIVELNGTNNTLVRSFAWGLDLSGSLSGAGGVDGLAWVTLHTASGPASRTHFTCYDGNGNIVALVSATTGDVTARYEYGPFGEPIRISGPAATLNPFRFSTKRTDNTTDLVLYEYRIYSASMGKWPNRDPIGERVGVNLYGFVGNSPLNKVDHLGLDAAIINHGGYTGHTSFVIINPDGSVKAYHFYAKSHQTGKCCGLGSLLSVCCDKVNVWSETSGSLTNYLQSQQALGGDVKIVAYALGTPLDDQLSLEDLNEQDKADAGIYSIAAGIECHKKSWDWFNDYLEGGPEIHPTLLPGQPWPPYWPERWFETRRYRQQSFPQVPAPPTPAPAP